MIRPSAVLLVILAAVAAAEPPALPLVADASLDPATGLLAVTLRCTGTEAVRVEAASLHQARASYAFRLIPVDPVPGIIERSGSRRVEATPAPRSPGAIVIAGAEVAGYAFPIWEAGFWADFPACFDQAPRWRVVPVPALAVPMGAGRPDELRPCAELHGFVIDRDLWERLQHLRWK